MSLQENSYRGKEKAGYTAMKKIKDTELDAGVPATYW